MRSGRELEDQDGGIEPRLRLAEGEIHIWWVDVSAYEIQPHDESILDRDETARAAAFRFDENRTRYIVSHIALRRILSRYTKFLPEQLQFEISGRGKPRLRRNPSEFEFNLSRTGNWICVAVTGQHPVGVDIEKIEDLPDLDRLAARCLCAQEMEAFEQMRLDARRETFYRIWTAKEAYTKCLGEGLSLPLQSLSVRRIPETEHLLVRATDDARGSERQLEGRSLDVERGLFGAVVLKGPIRQIEHRHLPWV